MFLILENLKKITLIGHKNIILKKHSIDIVEIILCFILELKYASSSILIITIKNDRHIIKKLIIEIKLSFLIL